MSIMEWVHPGWADGYWRARRRLGYRSDYERELDGRHANGCSPRRGARSGGYSHHGRHMICNACGHVVHTVHPAIRPIKSDILPAPKWIKEAYEESLREKAEIKRERLRIDREVDQMRREFERSRVSLDHQMRRQLGHGGKQYHYCTRCHLRTSNPSRICNSCKKMIEAERSMMGIPKVYLDQAGIVKLQCPECSAIWWKTERTLHCPVCAARRGARL